MVVAAGKNIQVKTPAAAGAVAEGADVTVTGTVTVRADIVYRISLTITVFDMIYLL